MLSCNFSFLDVTVRREEDILRVLSNHCCEKKCLRQLSIEDIKCDPPRENREKGECTGTHALARHAKRVTHRTDMCIFIKQNKECHG